MDEYGCWNTPIFEARHCEELRTDITDVFSRTRSGRRGTAGGHLVDVFRGRAAAHPDRVAFTFLPDGEQQTQQATYA